MTRMRVILKWLIYVLAGIGVLFAAAVIVMRVWLERSPEIAPQVVVRVESLSGLQFGFSSLDARLGWDGPELVFRNARITVPGQHDAVVTALAGRVGFDWWRALRTGRLGAGRLVLQGAKLYVYRTEAGVELRGQGDIANSANGAHLSVNDLPVGRLRIEDASITLQDLRRQSEPWHIDRVSLDIDRDPAALDLEGSVRLPDALGTHLDISAHLSGDLASETQLEWSTHIRLAGGSFAGFTTLMPVWSGLPTSGMADLDFTARGRGGALDAITGRFMLKDVLLGELAPAGEQRLSQLAGQISLAHLAARWDLVAKGITIDPGHDAWRAGDLHVTVDQTVDGIRYIALRSPELPLDRLVSLAALMPAGGARDALLALAPRGKLSAVDLSFAHGVSPGQWTVNGLARFQGLGMNAWGKLPGFTGINGVLTGQGDHGHLQVGSKGFMLDLQEYLPAPVYSSELAMSLDWSSATDGWRLAVDSVHSFSADGSGDGKAQLWLPADNQSPQLDLDIRLNDIDARHAARYLPERKYPSKVSSWLDAALLAGKVTNAQLRYRGPVRNFPFRDGSGVFEVRVPFSGLTMHYRDGFANIEELDGVAEFRNEGFSSTVSHARVLGLEIGDGSAAMVDFKTGNFIATASAHGNLKDALAFLQSSPIGPTLGDYFQHLTGRGALVAKVKLEFPFTHFADRHIEVSGHLAQANVTAPGVTDEIKNLTGSFVLRDRELRVSDATANWMGGVTRLKATTVRGPTPHTGERVLVVSADGTALADKVQKQLGISRGEWFSGQLPWHGEMRMPWFEWQPRPVVEAGALPGSLPQAQDIKLRALPISVHWESALGGFGIALPGPIAKTSDVTRIARLDALIDPAVPVDAPPLPRKVPALEQGLTNKPKPSVVTVRAQLGQDNAVFEWVDNEAYQLKRGTVRFGGGAAALKDVPGVWLEGRLPDFDLSAWLSVRLTDKPGSPMSDYLRGANVLVDRFNVLGFGFNQVALALEARAGAWRATVSGPTAQGTVVIPWNSQGLDPLSITLDHLAIDEHALKEDALNDSEADSVTDPAMLPAMTLQVRDLQMRAKRFGALEAVLRHDPHGLILEHAALTGASYRALVHGSWMQSLTGQKSKLAFTLDSTNLKDTLGAWGFDATLSGKSGHASGDFSWSGGPQGDLLAKATGNVNIRIDTGELMTVAPGAGRVLGLLSIAALPRRLTLDFKDLTDKGFAFDYIKGDFEFRDANAYTTNLVLKGPAAEIGVVGRTGLKAHDYDQTAKVTGNLGGSIAAAGALAGGPAVGAALLLFSTVFKEPLSGIARGYYRITGSWDQPKVERIGASAARDAEGALENVDAVPAGTLR